MKSTFLLLLSSLISLNIHAQISDFEVPQNYSLKGQGDFLRYEEDVLKGIIWLEEVAFDEQVEKQKEVRRFVLEWLVGTPLVTISISSYVTDLSSKNPELLLTFLGGWGKLVMQNPEMNKKSFEGNKAGVEAVLKYYSKNRENGIKKNKTIESLLKLQEEGKLDNWIESKLEK